MKKTIIILTLLIPVWSTHAQEINVLVSIAESSVDCGSTDLGFQVYSGNGNPSELKKSATKDMAKDYPNADNIDNYDNVNWGGYLGEYLVVISTTTTNTNGCKRFTYGVGFGKDSANAMEKAKANLRARNWKWLESKHGLKLELDEKL